MLGVSIELAQSGLRTTDTDLRPWGWPQGICCSPSSGKIPQSKHLGQPWSPGCFARLCGHPTRLCGHPVYLLPGGKDYMLGSDSLTAPFFSHSIRGRSRAFQEKGKGGQ